MYTKKNKVINEIRAFIREEIRNLKEEWWAEAYDKGLMDDPNIDEKSVYVPDDVKDTIKKWVKSMGLDARKR